MVECPGCWHRGACQLLTNETLHGQSRALKVEALRTWQAAAVRTSWAAADGSNAQLWLLDCLV